MNAVRRPEPPPDPADLPRAERALLELAVAWHGWNRTQTSDALLACKTAGWSFHRIFAAASDQLRRPDGSPDSIRHAAAARPEPGSRPADGSAWAAEIRRTLGRRDDPEVA